MGKKTKEKKRYKVTKPLLSKKNQHRLRNAERITRLIPEPTSQNISSVIRVTREIGKRVKKDTTIVRVKKHYRNINGKKVYVRPHKRIIKKEYKLKVF